MVRPLLGLVLCSLVSLAAAQTPPTVLQVRDFRTTLVRSTDGTQMEGLGTVTIAPAEPGRPLRNVYITVWEQSFTQQFMENLTATSASMEVSVVRVVTFGVRSNPILTRFDSLDKRGSGASAFDGIADLRGPSAVMLTTTEQSFTKRTIYKGNPELAQFVGTDPLTLDLHTLLSLTHNSPAFQARNGVSQARVRVQYRHEN